MAKRTPPRPRTQKPAAQAPESTVETPPESAADLGSASSSMGSEPSEEDIRMRAYQRYLERGGGHGQDFDDWLEAERDLKGRG